jgi:hypothetical protein
MAFPLDFFPGYPQAVGFFTLGREQYGAALPALAL